MEYFLNIFVDQKLSQPQENRLMTNYIHLWLYYVYAMSYVQYCVHLFFSTFFLFITCHCELNTEMLVFPKKTMMLYPGIELKSNFVFINSVLTELHCH